MHIQDDTQDEAKWSSAISQGQSYFTITLY